MNIQIHEPKAGERFYTVDDERWPSVTEVLDSKSDPGIAYARATWVQKEALRLTALHCKGLKAVQPGYVWNGAKYERCMTEHDPLDLLTDADYMMGAATRGGQAAMDRGSLANEFLDEHFAGGDASQAGLDDLPDWLDNALAEGRTVPWADLPVPYRCQAEEALPYVVSAYHWVKDSGFRIVAAQVKVAHAKDRYAGTMDALAEKGGLWSLEFKTGAEPKRSHFVQKAAYRAALASIGVKVKGSAVVVLSPECHKTCPMEPRRYLDCRQEFSRLLASYRFGKRAVPWSKAERRNLDSFDQPVLRTA